MFGHQNRSPIAIDVQVDHVVAVQLVRRRGKWQTAVSVTVRRASAEAATPAVTLSDAEMTALERGLARQGAVGREMVMMAPSEATTVELLELPPRGPHTPIEQLARAEMARLSRWDDATNFQLTTWDVPAPSRRAGNDMPPPTALYAAALPEGALDALLAQFWERHWSIRQVVPPSLAAAAVPADSDGDVAGATAVVIDLRANRAALTLVRGAVPIYHRDLPDNGLSVLLRAIVAELHMSSEDAASALESGSIDLAAPGTRARAVCQSFAEALAVELEASIAFASRRYVDVKITQLLLVGQGARIRGLAQWLRARLEIVDQPADGPSDSVDPVLAPCVALAKAATQSATDAGLLPSGHRALRNRLHVARLWLAGAAMIAIAAIAGLAGLYALSMSPTTVSEARLAAFLREQVRLDAQAADINRGLAEARATAAFEERLATQPDYSAVLRLVGTAMDRTTVLREIALSEPAPAAAAGPAKSTPPTSSTRRLRLAGTAPAAADLTNLVASLRAMDVFANVELARTSRSAEGDGVSFELTLDVVAPTAPKGAK